MIGIRLRAHHLKPFSCAYNVLRPYKALRRNGATKIAAKSTTIAILTGLRC